MYGIVISRMYEVYTDTQTQTHVCVCMYIFTICINVRMLMCIDTYACVFACSGLQQHSMGVACVRACMCVHSPTRTHHWIGSNAHMHTHIHITSHHITPHHIASHHIQMVADDRLYLASELEKAGVDKPGDRIKIINTVSRMMQ